MCLFGTQRRSSNDDDDSSSSDDGTEKLHGYVMRKRDNPLKGKKREPRFLIIGAGAAGLACATRLVNDGHHLVQIIEAEQRIGGRIQTVQFADNVVDMGAQWCHGQSNNVVYEMLADRNLLATTGDNYVTFQCIRSNGEIVSDEIVHRLKDMLSDIFIARQGQLQSFPGSFGDYLLEKFTLALSDPIYNDIDRTVAHEFFENFKKIESSETGSAMNQVSAAGFDEYVECDGDYLLNFKDKGYIEFLRALLKSDTSPSEFGVLEGKIFFGQTVEQVIWNTPDTVVRVKVKDQEIAYEAEHVIVTVSLGVLKKCYKEMFSPTLPITKQIAIEGLGFGEVCKIYLEFPHMFWSRNWTGFSALWRLEDYEELQRMDRRWIADIYGFYTLSYQSRVLQGWCVGSNVIRIETMPKEELQMNCMYLLRRFLKHWQIPEPLNIKCTSWSSNANFRGSYSYRSMQTERVGTNALSLAQPLTVLTYVPTFANDPSGSTESILPMTIKPVVLFAGEATSSHYYSTVHGAVESGWREANRVHGYYSI